MLHSYSREVVLRKNRATPVSDISQFPQNQYLGELNRSSKVENLYLDSYSMPIL